MSCPPKRQSAVVQVVLDDGRRVFMPALFVIKPVMLVTLSVQDTQRRVVTRTMRRTDELKGLMDYYYDPVNAATVAAYVNYVCPVEGAREAMEAIDPELVENPLIFPTDEFLANTHVVRTLTPDEETDFSDRFQTAIGN